MVILLPNMSGMVWVTGHWPIAPDAQHQAGVDCSLAGLQLHQGLLVNWPSQLTGPVNVLQAQNHNC